MHLLRTTVRLCALMTTLGSVVGCSDDDDKLETGAGGAQATGGTKATGGGSNRGGATAVGGSEVATGGSSVIASTAGGSNGVAGTSAVGTTTPGGQSFAGNTASTGGTAVTSSGGNVNVAGQGGNSAATGGTTVRSTGGSGNVAGQGVAGTAASTAGAAGAPPAVTYSVSGTVSGLLGTTGLVLSTGAGTTPLTVSADGAFAFPARFTAGSNVTVSIATQPTSPHQTCVVSASGAITSIAQNVVDVAVTCTTNSYSVGGGVQGLLGTGLVLQNNAGDDLPVAANGAFTFPVKVESKKDFAVSIKTQPTNPTQDCTLAGNTGTIGGADVKTVSVNCASDAFIIGGNVTGLQGTGLILQNNAGDDLTLTASGSFAFPTAVATNSTYTVSVKQQPSNPLQACVVTPATATGTVGTHAVSTVEVTCTNVALRSLSGTVTNLLGSGLVLTNGTEDLPVAKAAGAFSFVTQYPDGTHYKVQVKAQPTDAWQTCSVTNAESDFAGDVTNVAVNCVSNPFTLSVNVTGLTGSGLVLQNNAGDDLAIAAAAGAPVVATFTTPVLSGAGYKVTVKQNPTPSQACKVTAPEGSVANANLSLEVKCADTYPISGTTQGPLGSGLVLSNGTVDYPISTPGPFTLPGEVAVGDTYNWSVKTQPTGAAYSCEVTGGSGTMGTAAVTTVKVVCPVYAFTYGTQGWFLYNTPTGTTLTPDATAGSPGSSPLGALSASLPFSETNCPSNMNIAGGFGTLDLTGATKASAYIRVNGVWPTTDRSGVFRLFLQGPGPSYPTVAQGAQISWYAFALDTWYLVSFDIPVGTDLTQIASVGINIWEGTDKTKCQATTILIDSVIIE